MVNENSTNENTVLTEEHATQLEVIEALADLGNGQTDIKVNGNRYTFDSGYRRTNLEDLKITPEEVFNYGRGLIDSTYATVISPAVSRENGAVLAFGKQMKAGRGIVKLPNGDKVKSESPIIHLLTTLAVNKVQEEYDAIKDAEKLADATFKINVDLLTALPARESTFENRVFFANKLLNKEHTVLIYLAKTKFVKVEINFTNVKVKSEGSLAYNAMLFESPGVFNNNELLFEGTKKLYDLESYGGKDIAATDGFKMLIDIGEITTEIHIFDEDNELITTIAIGIEAGTKHVFQSAARTLSDVEKYRIPYKQNEVNRREITTAIRNEDHPELDEIMDVLITNSTSVAASIADEIEEINTNLDGNVKVAIVIGGGSIIMKEKLLPMMRDILETTQPDAKVVYVPKEFAQEIFFNGMEQYKEETR